MIKQEYRRIPCAIFRGGTSKGIIINKQYLPDDPTLRDQIIVDIFGSQSYRQIDGLGGATALTSKVAIIEKSQIPGIDIKYTFGQVGIESGGIDYSINCGNILAAVALFSIQENIVPVTKPHTSIKILNTNSRKLITATIKTGYETPNTKQSNNLPKSVPVALTFINPVGSKTGNLLPTGRVIDTIHLSGLKRIQVSVVDSGTVYIFIDASQLGVKGNESITKIESNAQLLIDLDNIKTKVKALMLARPEAEKINLKIALISPPQSFTTEDGKVVNAEDINLISKIVNSEKVHTAYAVTGAVCLSTAILVVGTVVSNLQIGFNHNSNTVRIGNPRGIIEAGLDYSWEMKELVIKNIHVLRTARKIMDGYVYL